MYLMTDRMPNQGQEFQMNAHCANCGGSGFRARGGSFVCLGCGVEVMLEGRSACYWAGRRWSPLAPQRPAVTAPALPAVPA